MIATNQELDVLLFCMNMRDPTIPNLIREIFARGRDRHEMRLIKMETEGAKNMMVLAHLIPKLDREAPIKL